MVYRWMADGIALAHGLLAGFLALGPLWARRRPRLRAVHLVFLWFAVFLAAIGQYCPLAAFENSLRARYDPGSTYSSGFVVRYVDPLVWWELTDPQVVTAMVLWTLLWTVVYVRWWRRERRDGR